MISKEPGGFKISISVPPFILEGTELLAFENPFIPWTIDKVSWKYQYVDVGVPSASRITVVPIKVTLGNLLVNSEKAAYFLGNQKMTGSLPIKVKNTNIANNHKMEVEIFLHGSNPPQLYQQSAGGSNSGLAPLKSPNACDCPTAVLLMQGCQNPTHI